MCSVFGVTAVHHITADRSESEDTLRRETLLHAFRVGALIDSRDREPSCLLGTRELRIEELTLGCGIILFRGIVAA